MIRETYETYEVEGLQYKQMIEAEKMQNGFVIKLRLSEICKRDKSKLLLCIPNMLTIHTGVLSKEQDIEELTPYQWSECYFSYVDCDGKSPYLSASIWLQKEDWVKPKEMSLGIPLALYSAYDKDVCLYYDGIRFAWIIDGEIVNLNYPLGQLVYEDGEVFVDEVSFASFGYCDEVIGISTVQCVEDVDKSITFYSPRGYNEWVGDTMNFYHDGVYHLLFLSDRHHHGNRFGGGAHNVVHLTTKDFINWENHGVIYPIKTQWQSFGTGSMFYYQGKYYFSFGYHSSRTLPEDKLASNLLKEGFEVNGEVTAISYEEIGEKGLYPSGANCLVSDDGIHFTQSNIQFHWSENPCIYVVEDALSLYAGYGGEGVWKAKDIRGPWQISERESSIYHMHSPMRNSSECPSKFTWGDYNYLLMGFTGFWQKRVDEDIYEDMALKGMDLYDGLCVPMVANCAGRYILAGWVAGYGWAYLLQQRELVQKENGHLGMRWLPELTPDVNGLRQVAFQEQAKEGRVFSLDSRRSYYLTCNVSPQENAKVGFGFSGEGDDFVLQLDTQKRKVQIRETNNPKSFVEELPALYEVVNTLPEHIQSYHNIVGTDWHFKSHDFAIGNVEELQKPYQLKMILHYEPKKDSLVLDVEIDEGRTLISNRMYFKAEAICILMEHATVSELRLYEL